MTATGATMAALVRSNWLRTLLRSLWAGLAVSMLRVAAWRRVPLTVALSLIHI